ncbi:MAG: hypothetical protein IKP58_03225 [Victivallales bacterium]|nr:hypothetical protein [Victivallales bacterium]
MNQEPLTGCLRPDIELIRGDRPLLFDRQADAYYRIPSDALPVLSVLTESMPVSAFMEKLAANGINISREDLLRLLAFLQMNNLLVPEYGVIEAKRRRLSAIRHDNTLLKLSSAYIFFKLPPLHPENFYAHIRPMVGWLASKFVVLTLLLPAIIGYLLLVRDLNIVHDTFLNSLSWAGLVKYFIAIVILKIAHESAHSLAAIHFNCRVRSIGIGFVIFVPRFFTDTTDSWRLPRLQRLLIDAAGIITEIIIGGIAALAWTYLPSGELKSTLFFIFAVSTLSTILVNGNPFIRYDGYYILSDILGIENLMSRSSDHFKQWWRWHFLRLGAKPVNKHGKFLLLYGLGCFIYRIFLYTSIILVIYHKFVKAVALVMVFLEIYSILIYPAYREIQTIRILSKRSVNRARLVIAAALLAFAAIVVFTPLPWTLRLPAEITLQNHRVVSVQESGYLTTPLPHVQTDMQLGQTIAALASPMLDFAIKRLDTVLKYDETLFNFQKLDIANNADSIVTAEKIVSDNLSRNELLRRQNCLAVNAPCAGIFLPHTQELSANAFLPRGMVIGEIISGSPVLRAYATDAQIGRLAIGQNATVRLRDSIDIWNATIVSINQVPSRLTLSPLIQFFGGPIPAYLPENGTRDYVSVLPLYSVELAFHGDDRPLPAVGRIASVSIGHSERLYDKLRIFVMSAFRKEL